MHASAEARRGGRPGRARGYRRLSMAVALVLGCAPLSRPASAQQASPATLLSTSGGRLHVTLLGGWASFAQGPINDSIRLDNILLTAPVDSGGVGLDEGLAEIADGIGLGVEVRLRLSPYYSLVAGVQRLYDRSRVTFTYDSGTGPEPGYIEYSVEDWPVYLGVYREFTFTDRVDYRIGGMLVWFPASDLSVSGRIGPGFLDEKGTTTGLGGMFSFGGDIALGGRLALTAATRLRLGRIGDPKDEDGDVIQDYLGTPLAPMDWSGVDVVLGITYRIF